MQTIAQVILKAKRKQQEHIRKPSQFCELQRLRAQPGVDAGLGDGPPRVDRPLLGERLDRIEQGLPPLGENRAHEPLEDGLVLDIHDGIAELEAERPPNGPSESA